MLVLFHSHYQLSYALSMLFDSGYEIEQAFKLVLELIDNKKLKTKLINVNNKLDNGENIENALIEEAIFKGLYNQMIILGFKAGKHNEVMSSIAIAYEDEVNKSINKFLNIIHNVDNKKLNKYSKKAIKTFLNFENYIINSFDYELSNGIVEGTNNLIKQVKHNACGYIKFTHLKARIMLIKGIYNPLNA